MSADHGPVQAVGGSAVVLVDDRLGDVVPAAAVALLRGAAAVYAAEGLADSTRTALAASAPPPREALLEQAARERVVLLAPDESDPLAAALAGAGAQRVGAPAPSGSELLDAVAVMDRLRSPGGCPWDAEQTHDSLRRYLVEETYELLEALEHRDRVALREELGDVLLQVLFHARVAAEDGTDPFDIDGVAAGLVSKLVARHPHVFSGAEHVHDAESQQKRWEELKRSEKQRESIVDGVATGQPAVALAAKLAQRAGRVSIPAELLPGGHSTGEGLFSLAAEAVSRGEDPEDELRTAALRFGEQVRAAERRARESGHDPAELTPQQWRDFWHG